MEIMEWKKICIQSNERRYYIDEGSHERATQLDLDPHKFKDPKQLYLYKSRYFSIVT